MRHRLLPPLTTLAAIAVVAFLLGGLWFSPSVFGKLWKKANGFGADAVHGSEVIAALCH